MSQKRINRAAWGPGQLASRRRNCLNCCVGATKSGQLCGSGCRTKTRPASSRGIRAGAREILRSGWLARAEVADAGLSRYFPSGLTPACAPPRRAPPRRQRGRAPGSPTRATCSCRRRRYSRASALASGRNIFPPQCGAAASCAHAPSIALSVCSARSIRVAPQCGATFSFAFPPCGAPSPPVAQHRP